MTHASLFSGIGGFDLAAEWMGWHNAFHCEINEFCTRILKYHFPNAEHYTDITKTDFSKWRGCIDVLSGGFPCQPFSVAGKRKGADDDRYLWPQMLRAIREIRPTWVIGENVGGIVTMVQPGKTVELGSSTSLFGEDYKDEEIHQQYVVETICTDLEREEYSVQPILIPACAVGAPHRRDRVWFVARRLQNNNNETRTGYNCRQGRLRLSESMVLESEQLRICLQDNQSKGRWEEMEDYLNAQIDLLCGYERGDRPYQQEQVRQQKVKFKDSCTLGELSQPLKGNRCKKTQRTEQMVCSNLCEQQKNSFRMLQDKRGSNECENQCRKRIIANRTDSGAESMQQTGQNSIPAIGFASDTCCIGRTGRCCKSDRYENKKTNRTSVLGKTERLSRKQPSSDAKSEQSERYKPEQSTNGSTKQRELRRINSENNSEYAIRGWENFPTQSPVCCRNDGISTELYGITFPKWREESVKAYGNAIVPQVAYEIFKAIQETYNQ